MDVQILRVGQFVILAVPGELTTMAGRRLREAIYDQVQSDLLMMAPYVPVKNRRCGAELLLIEMNMPI